MCECVCRLRLSFFLDAFRCPDRKVRHEDREALYGVFDEVEEDVILVEEGFYSRKISEIDDILMLDLIFQ